MFLGAYLPWILEHGLMGSSGTYISANAFVSRSPEQWHVQWHALFGSSLPLFAEFADAAGRIPIGCGIGVVAAAVLSVSIPVGYRIWAYSLAMSLAIVTMLDCLLVIHAVAVNDAKYASSVTISPGCYFTFLASLAALIVAFWSSRPRGMTDSERRYRGTARYPVSNADSAAIR